MTNIVIAASTSIYIPTAGYYSFDVDSDDGFGLTIPGVTFTTLTNATNSTGSDQMQYNGGRGTADTFGVADFTTVGYYPLSLLYFNGGGPGSLEVAAAAGSYTSWTSAFELVGDSTDGGLALGGTIIDTTTPPAPANLHAAVTANNHPDHAGVEPRGGTAQRRRSLQHLSQRQRVRHVDHDQLRGHQRHLVAVAVFVPGHGGQLRRRRGPEIGRRDGRAGRHRRGHARPPPLRF